VIELLVFGAIAGALVLAAGIGFAVLAVMKLVFWLVFLPVRLFFKLLFLPFLLLKWLFIGVFGLVLAPILLLVMGAAGLVLVAVFFVPLIPIVLLAIGIWAVFRVARRPATA
jgi:hypothetical protein